MPTRVHDARTRNWRFAGLAARVLVGGLFIVTAVGKIISPLEFAKEIQIYEMVPIEITHAMAIVLPWLEGVLGLLLLSCLWRAEARLLTAMLLVVFTVAKGYAYFALGKTGSCGCGGAIPILDALLALPQGIATNLVLIGLLGLDWSAARRTGPCATAPDSAPAGHARAPAAPETAGT